MAALVASVKSKNCINLTSYNAGQLFLLYPSPITMLIFSALQNAAESIDSQVFQHCLGEGVTEVKEHHVFVL